MSTLETDPRVKLGAAAAECAESGIPIDDIIEIVATAVQEHYNTKHNKPRD